MRFDISGLFSQHRFLPLFNLGGQGLQIQLSIAPAAASMILADAPDAVADVYSSKFHIEDIRLLADMITLNDDLQESYNAGLLGGSALRIPIRTWELQTVYLPADNVGQFDLALSKNYTRLASLHCLFNQLSLIHI